MPKKNEASESVNESAPPNDSPTRADDDTDSKDTDHDPSDVIEELEQLPEPVKRQVSLVMQSVFRGPMHNPIADKLNESHLDKLLDNSAREDSNQYKYYSTNRWFTLAYVLISVFLFVFILIHFSGDRDVLSKY